MRVCWDPGCRSTPSASPFVWSLELTLTLLAVHAGEQTPDFRTSTDSTLSLESSQAASPSPQKTRQNLPVASLHQCVDPYLLTVFWGGCNSISLVYHISSFTNLLLIYKPVVVLEAARHAPQDSCRGAIGLHPLFLRSPAFSTFFSLSLSNSLLP